MRELLALRAGVRCAILPDGDVRMFAWPDIESLGKLDDADLALLKDGEFREGALVDRLRAGGWLRITVTYDGRPLYTVDPHRAPPPSPAPDGSTPVLSRFAVLHQEDDGLVLESPRAWCDLRLHDPTALTVLGRPDHLPPEVTTRLAHDLRWSGLAVSAPEDGEFRLCQWRPHELWFHERSRRTTRGGPFGSTGWARDRFEPLPVRPEEFPGPVVQLDAPDLDALRRDDPPLTAVLEDRRTLREHDEANPITVGQLGELLYRCARNRRTYTRDGVEYADRPYPSGGAVHELELYPVVRNVAGLAPGMYHYDGTGHRLRLVRAADQPAVRRLLQTSAPPAKTLPQVLVVYAARVGRLMWQYEAMPYSLILKHVGVLMQTMYCVATAMGLAPCAVGAGDSVAFTEATGRDPLEECSVGEFAVGSRHR